MTSVCGTPLALSCRTPAEATRSSSTEAIQTVRGRRETREPVARHRPFCPSRPVTSSGSRSVSGSSLGRKGQNAARPSSAISAGSRVSAAKSEQRMPAAATGPRALLELRSENSRQRSAMMTVAPEATMGSHEFFHAVSAAAVRLVVCVSASRNRAT